MLKGTHGYAIGIYLDPNTLCCRDIAYLNYTGKYFKHLHIPLFQYETGI